MYLERSTFLHIITYIYYVVLVYASAQEAGNYLSNQHLYRRMVQVAEDYPDLTHIYSIGKSQMGQELYVIAISGVDPDKHIPLRPETKYVANIHGNEPTGRELLIKLMYYLTSNYKFNKDIRVTKLLQSTRLHLLPTINPDGFDSANLTAHDCMGDLGRENANGIDLNRDFPDFFNPLHQRDGYYQAETAAIIRWSTDTQFVLSGSLHAGALVANYPYDNIHPQSKVSYAEHLAPDDDTFQFLARKYSYSHPRMPVSSCPNLEFEDGITSGVTWYPAQGTMQDYNYLFAGCMDLTLELNCCKTPLYEETDSDWEANRDPLIIYISQVDMGVKGIVRYKDGIPAAGLSIVVENTLAVKTTPLGEFWKLVLPGDYTLKVMIQNLTLSSIEVTAVKGRASVYNITLPQSSSEYLSYVLNITNHTINAATQCDTTIIKVGVVSLLTHFLSVF